MSSDGKALTCPSHERLFHRLSEPSRREANLHSPHFDFWLGRQHLVANASLATPYTWIQSEQALPDTAIGVSRRLLMT